MLFMCVTLFMLFIMESLFIDFTKKIFVTLLKFTHTVYKSLIKQFYIVFALIFDFVLYFSCLIGCVVW